MVRGVILILIAVLLAAAAGVGLCSALGWRIDVSAIIVAAIAAILAGELGLIPLWLARQGGPAAVAQAALVGTMIHMFVLAGVAAAVFLGRFSLGAGFVYWLFGFYCVTLTALAVALVGSLRRMTAAAK